MCVPHRMFTVPLSTRENQYQFVATRCFLHTQNDDARSKAYHNHTKRSLLHSTSFTSVSGGMRMCLCLRLLLRTPFTVIRRMTQIQIARTLSQRSTYVSTRHVRCTWTHANCYQPASQPVHEYKMFVTLGIWMHRKTQRKKEKEPTTVSTICDCWFIYIYSNKKNIWKHGIVHTCHQMQLPEFVLTVPDKPSGTVLYVRQQQNFDASVSVVYLFSIFSHRLLLAWVCVCVCISVATYVRVLRLLVLIV